MTAPRSLPSHRVAGLLAALLASALAHADPPAPPPPDPLTLSLDEAARAAAADPRTRAHRAAPDPAEQLPPMRVERFTLPNGLDVVLVPDPSVRHVAVIVRYATGTGDSSPARTGLAHLAEHLTYGPTRHAPQGLLVATEDAMATSYNGITSIDETHYFAEVPAGALERALWVESERMAFALDGVTDEALRHERAVVTNEYFQHVREQTGGDLGLALARELYPEGHLRRVPYETGDRLARVTLDDVRGFLARSYVPANARLTVAGHIDAPTTRAMVTRYFGDIARAPAPARTHATEMPTLSSERVLRYRAPHASWEVQVWWPTPALHRPGDIELDVVATLARRREEASLHHALVEGGFATELRIRQHSFETSSEFGIAATVAQGHTHEEVLDVIDRELVRLRRAPPDPARVARAVAELRQGVAEDAQRFFSRASMIAEHPEPEDPGRYRTTLARYAAVTPEAVRAAVERWLPLERRVVVMLRGDASTPESGIVESVRSR